MTTAQIVAQRALDLFSERYGEFNKHNTRHVECGDDCITDAYLERARKSTHPKYLPSTSEVQTEFYNLTS